MSKSERDQYEDLPRTNCALSLYKTSFTDLPLEHCLLVVT